MIIDEVLRGIFVSEWRVIVIVSLLLGPWHKRVFRSLNGGIVRRAFSTVLLPLFVAVVLTLISDLDALRRGLIGIGKRPLLDLQKSFQSPSR
jgi:hypothetical protein